MTPRLVLFDLDGTLIDSVGDLAAAADEMMRALDRVPPGEEKVRRYVGNGIHRLVHRCLSDDMHADAPGEEFAHASALFMTFYEQHNGRHSTIFQGVPECLEHTRGAGVAMGCVTNKSERFTLPLLQALGLSDYFSLVVCGDTTAHQKPHPAPLLHALDHYGVVAQHALFVGDSSNDVQAARAAHIPVVCVDYGYNHGEDIALSKPDAILSSLVDLRDLIKP
jgi:phosphoglycolate phosphatase